MRHNGWRALSKLVCALAGAMAVLPAAQAQSAVMLEAGNQRLRDDLQWLADRGIIRLSTSAWPLPLSAVQAALDARARTGLKPADTQALVAVEREIARHTAPWGYGATLGVNTAKLPVTGFDAPVRGRAEAGAWVQGSRGAMAGKLQAQGLGGTLTDRQSHVDLEGSYVAAQWAGQVLYAGQLPHWWGPGQDGSLVWSNVGLAIPGVGLRRGSEAPFVTPWLSWLGPWGYEVFIGRMQNNLQVPGARVFAMNLHIEPLPRLQLGASRLINWGGPVGDNSLRGLRDAFLGRANEVPGPVNNEIGGFDARYTWLPGGNPLSLYGQFIGEDEAGALPSNFIGLAGMQYQHMLGGTRMQWHVEAADTMTRRLFGIGERRPNTAYLHTQFTDGMYHEGLPIGHFLGGDGRAFSVGVNLTPLRSPYRARYRIRLVGADVNPSNQIVNLAFPTSDKVRLAEVSASWQARSRLFGPQPFNVMTGFTALRSSRNGNEAGLTLKLEVPL